MRERQAKLRERLTGLAPQLAFLKSNPCRTFRSGLYVDEVTQIGFAAPPGLSGVQAAYVPVAGLSGQSSMGLCDGAERAARQAGVPVLSINGDGGFLYTGNELATAIRHQIPLVAIVFVDGAFGNVRRIQQEQFGNRLIACDLANPDFVKYAESFGAAGLRARSPEELGAALRKSFKRREPTLIEVPVFLPLLR